MFILDRRLELHALLLTMGTSNVYFQAPPGDLMNYPCIIYKRDSANTNHADNSPYRHAKRYMVTIIDRDPDSLIPDNVATLPSASFSRNYASDNLNHDVYTLYY